MDELEKLKADYECLKKNYDAMCQRSQQAEHNLFEAKQENERLWRLVENLSVALKGGPRP